MEMKVMVNAYEISTAHLINLLIKKKPNCDGAESKGQINGD